MRIEVIAHKDPFRLRVRGNNLVDILRKIFLRPFLNYEL